MSTVDAEASGKVRFLQGKHSRRHFFMFNVLFKNYFSILSSLSGVLFSVFKSIIVNTVWSTLLAQEYSCLHCQKYCSCQHFLQYSSSCLGVFSPPLSGVLFFLFRSILVYTVWSTFLLFQKYSCLHSLEYSSSCLGVFLSTLSGVLFFLFRSILVYTVWSTLYSEQLHHQILQSFTL